MNVRTELWWLVFFGFAVNYMLRININIAIVDMVVPNINDHIIMSACVPPDINETIAILRIIEALKKSKTQTHFHWNEVQQNVILSGYFWTHWILQLPGGILAHRYGTKRVVGYNNLIVALLTFLIPVSASFGYHWLFVVRAAQGVVAGSFWPAMSPLVSKWVPPHERAMFLSSYLGSSVGTALTYFVCGFIIDLLGWQYVFYVTGVVGVIWSVVWLIRVYDTPEEHPRISKKERKYIIDSLGDTLDYKHDLPIPWKKMLLSRPVWINVMTQWGANGAVFALLIHTPMYLKYIHGLDIKSNGVWSGVPHLTRWILALLFGWAVAYQSFLSLTNIRKVANGLGTIAVAFMIFGLAFSDCNTMLALMFLMIAVTLQGTIPAGAMGSVIDMTPNFSGVLQGFVGVLSVTPGFIYPILVGYLTENNQTLSQWKIFFCIVSCLTLICGILYTIFGTSEVQPWNSESDHYEEEHRLSKITINKITNYKDGIPIECDMSIRATFLTEDAISTSGTVTPITGDKTPLKENLEHVCEHARDTELVRCRK